ncbi:MAG: hypothetical protein WCG87_09495 [Bacteroidota bacterium]
MSDLPDIISSKVVHAEWDTFWDDMPDSDSPLSPKTVLVLSTPFVSGTNEESQLQKMLQACKLTNEQYNVIQIDTTQNIAWYKMRLALTPQLVLLLGVIPQQLGITAMFRFNEPNTFNDCLVIPTLSLSELEKLPEAKKQLWNQALKPILVDNTYGIMNNQ